MRIVLLGNETPMKRKCVRELSDYHIVNERWTDEVDLGILVNYPYTLKKGQINSYPMGFINLHYSLLPDYRGRHPVVWAMLNGEKRIGLTVHHVDEGIDTGDIILQTSIPVYDNDTYTSILEELEKVGPRLLRSAVDLLEMGCAPRTKQGKGKYYRRRTPEDSEIPKELWTDARKLVRFINAHTDPLPNAFIFINNSKVEFKGARCEL